MLCEGQAVAPVTGQALKPALTGLQMLGQATCAGVHVDELVHEQPLVVSAEAAWLDPKPRNRFTWKEVTDLEFQFQRDPFPTLVQPRRQTCAETRARLARCCDSHMNLDAVSI